MTKTLSRAVGSIYLAGFVVGIAGNIFLQSPGPQSLVALGALLWLLAAVGDAAHGVLLFPLLRTRAERLALGYLAARLCDALLVSLMVLFTLVPETKAAAPMAYNFGMIALALAGLILNTALFRLRLIPAWLSLWGLVGYAVLGVGMSSELFAPGWGLASTLPGGLWEIFMGGWLILRGFEDNAQA